MNRREFTTEFYFWAGKIELHLQRFGTPLMHTPRNQFDLYNAYPLPDGTLVSVLDAFNYHVFGETFMAKKQKWSVEFVNVDLSKDEKNKFTKWFNEKGDSITQMVADLLSADNRLGLSYNPETKSYICSITGKEDSLNPNKCITSHAPTWFMALALTAYKVVVILKDGVWEGDGEEDFG